MARSNGMLAACLLAALTLATPHTARAGVLDHLICYRIKDPIGLKVAMDLITQNQPDFTQKGCFITKAIEFCVPATKTNVTSKLHNQPVFPNISGPSLSRDYLCYKTKCDTKNVPQSRVVADQFGSRTELKWQVAKVCVPAKKISKGCGFVAPHQCGGDCPDPAQQCQPMANDGGCECVPHNPGCYVDAAGQCTGVCPINPGVKCVYDAAGICGCDGTVGCQQSAPACNGTCPAPATCISDPATGNCNCNTPTPECDGSAPACNGLCPNGVACVHDLTANKCTCGGPVECKLSGPACNGDCPAGSKCVTDAATGACDCQALDCQQSGAPACNGSCPTGFACLANAVGCGCVPAADCQHSSAPACGGPCTDGTVCHWDGLTPGSCLCGGTAPTCGGSSPQCNGTCPVGQTCGAVPGTTQCGCQ